MQKLANQDRNRILIIIGVEQVETPFLVLAGSESVFTEITEYICFSQILTRVEFKCKLTEILYHPSIGPYDSTNSILEKHILLHTSGSWPITVRFLYSWADGLTPVGRLNLLR